MLNICLLFLIIITSFVIAYGFFRKDIFERLLYINTGTSLAALFICFLGSVKANNSYIDIALIYFLLSWVSTSAYMKYFLSTEERNKHDEY